MVEINSPFRYPGGKFYARKLILEHLIPHTFYAEPFAGGASLFFAKEKVARSLLNDKDAGLINCYLVIRDHVEELITLLDRIEAKKENHAYYKSVYQPTSDLERAFRWYYLNRISYSGIMNMQNCYWGYGDKYSMQPKNWPTHLRRCSKKLQDVEITCTDFEQALAHVPDGAFLFVDPPYFAADQDKFYTCSFEKETHFRLADVLRQHSHRLTFLLTYDNSPEVRALYDWTNQMLDKEWNYTISRTDDQYMIRFEMRDKAGRYTNDEMFLTHVRDEAELSMKIAELATTKAKGRRFLGAEQRVHGMTILHEHVPATVTMKGVRGNGTQK